MGKNDKKLFHYENGLAFAWAGGRYIIINEALDIADFGNDIKISGIRNRYREGVVENHQVCGTIKAVNSVWEFPEYGVKFDFDTLYNVYPLERNRIRHKELGKRHPWVIHHIRRFMRKQRKT